jgi:hypothetical protein
MLHEFQANVLIVLNKLSELHKISANVKEAYRLALNNRMIIFLACKLVSEG